MRPIRNFCSCINNKLLLSISEIMLKERIIIIKQMIILSGTSQATKIKQGYLYIKSNMGHIASKEKHTYPREREREKLKTSKGLKGLQEYTSG